MARVVSEVTTTKIRYLSKSIKDYNLDTEEGREELLKEIESLAGKRSMTPEKEKKGKSADGSTTTRTKKPPKATKAFKFV